ncbi:MAG: zinc metallopeptidase [Eubacterium sp.]
MYYAYYFTGIVMIPVLIFSLICQAKVNSNFNKYSRVGSSSGMTGADAAYRLLQLNGISDVKIKRIPGNLTDHYDPRTKEICLSDKVFASSSIAAIGVACHEAGHACQHANGYVPLKLRNAIIPVTRIGSWLGVPLCMVGLLINSAPVAYVGLVLYGFIALFQLATLPVEFNASRRALSTIQQYGFMSDIEYNGAKKVLTAAALTYVAALASSIATILRILLVLNGGRRR